MRLYGYSRNLRGERRLSPSLYKLLLTAHITVSVGWLGVVFAKLVLGLAAVTTSVPAVAAALYLSTSVVNVAFPPLAIGTIVSGVLLSLGTRWGLLQHYWVVTKLTLTVGVIATAVQLGDRLLRQASAVPSGSAADGAPILGLAAAPTLLLALSVVHLLMLGAATVISVYKPWGKTWFGRRQTVQQHRRQTPALTGR
jgi:hypothetical protein